MSETGGFGNKNRFGVSVFFLSSVRSYRNPVSQSAFIDVFSPQSRHCWKVCQLPWSFNGIPTDSRPARVLTRNRYLVYALLDSVEISGKDDEKCRLVSSDAEVINLTPCVAWKRRRVADYNVLH